MPQRSQEQAKLTPKADVHLQNPSLGDAACSKIGGATEQPSSSDTARATPYEKVDALTAAEGPCAVSFTCEFHGHD